MTLDPLDGVLLATGPILILVTWLFLPTAVDEGLVENSDRPASGVVAELVGYTFRPVGDTTAITIGRQAGVNLRLHRAPVPGRAAIFMPPNTAAEPWAVAPLEAGESLERLTTGRRQHGQTSLRPWDGQDEPIDVGCEHRRLRIEPAELRPVHAWGAAGARLFEPEVIWVHEGESREFSTQDAGVELLTCEGRPGVWWAPAGSFAGSAVATLCSRPPRSLQPADRCFCWPVDGACRSYGKSPAAQILGGVGSAAGSALTSVSIYGQPLVEEGDLWLRAATKLEHFRLGVDAGGCLGSDGQAGADCALRTQPVCDSSGQEIGRVGPIEIVDGDVLGIGRTRFLVGFTEGGGLRLLHVRHPNPKLGRSYFRGTSSAELYHPNRRAFWRLPICDTGGGDLILRIRPAERKEGSSEAFQRGRLVDRGRVRRQQVEQAAANAGVPLEIPSALGSLRADRETVSLCVEPTTDGGNNLRITPDGTLGVRVASGSLADLDDDGNRWTSATPALVALGSAGEPRESLIEIGGNLIRVAPAAGKRIASGFRPRLALFCIAVVTLLALPLTVVRRARARLLRKERRRARLISWPTDSGPATLLQLTGLAVVWLLFLGADYHLQLALLPELAGKPDYLQAFLEGLVGCTILLGLAAGFALGSTVLSRLGAALMGGAAMTGLAAAWWLWEAGIQAEGLWLSQIRNAVLPLYSSAHFGRSLGLLAFGLFAAGSLLVVIDLASRQRLSRAHGAALERAAAFALGHAGGVFVLLVLCAVLAAGTDSALAVELVVLVAIAWTMAHAWSFVHRPEEHGEPVIKRQVERLCSAAGVLTLLILAVFFVVGSRLPDRLSFALVLAAPTLLVLPPVVAFLRLRNRQAWWREMKSWHSEGRLVVRIVVLWSIALVLGIGIAAGPLNDSGSVAAWLPAILTGLFLWVVRPDDAGNRREELFRARAQLLLVAGGGLLLLGTLDVLAFAVDRLPFDELVRPRQRFELAEDVSYILPGEWIAQVRWLASRQDDGLLWVPNMNSDVAIFGLTAHHGLLFGLGASLALILIALCTAAAADQALREASAMIVDHHNRLYAVLYRWLGLSLFMLSVLLVAQWLIHLATGVALHLPITGLVFPWISHGNTTHMLYTALLTMPLALLAAFGNLPLYRLRSDP